MKTKFIFKIIAIAGFLFSTVVKGQITPANNFISIALTLPENSTFTWDTAIVMCKNNIGMSHTLLYYPWNTIETSPNTYDFSSVGGVDYWLNLSSAHNLPVILWILPIEAHLLTVPSDLDTAVALDSSIMINRFKTLLDSIKFHAIQSSAQISTLIIGSENDSYLSYYGVTDTIKWQQYINFYDTIANYARTTLWPGIKVQSELTYYGLRKYDFLAQQLNMYSDEIAISYLPDMDTSGHIGPPTVVLNDFDTIVMLYPSKQIHISQLVLPSDSICTGSSLIEQAQFIKESFTAWDIYSANIKMISFLWLHEFDTAYLSTLVNYYGLDSCTAHLLRSCGLRTYPGNGTNKPAFDTLICEAGLRGYNTLPPCVVSGIVNHEDKIHIKIFPNPFSSETTLQTGEILKDATLTVYNLFGQTIKQLKNISGQTVTLYRGNLPIGLYFVRLTEENKVITTDKLVITD